jgi:hypothetical protein
MQATQIRQKDGVFYFASYRARELLAKVRRFQRQQDDDLETLAEKRVPKMLLASDKLNASQKKLLKAKLKSGLSLDAIRSDMSYLANAEEVKFDAFKKVTILGLGAAMQRFGSTLGDEQEVLLWLADLLIWRAKKNPGLVRRLPLGDDLTAMGMKDAFIEKVPEGSFLSWRSPPPQPAATSATTDVASAAVAPLLPVTARGTYQSAERLCAGCGHVRLPFGSARDPPVVFRAGQARGALPNFP